MSTALSRARLRYRRPRPLTAPPSKENSSTKWSWSRRPALQSRTSSSLRSRHRGTPRAPHRHKPSGAAQHYGWRPPPQPSQAAPFRLAALRGKTMSLAPSPAASSPAAFVAEAIESSGSEAACTTAALKPFVMPSLSDQSLSNLVTPILLAFDTETKLF